jgi:hypothetical protein
LEIPACGKGMGLTCFLAAMLSLTAAIASARAVFEGLHGRPDSHIEPGNAAPRMTCGIAMHARLSIVQISIERRPAMAPIS